MAILTRHRLQQLLQAQSRPCISLYLPTHRRHPESQQDPIRFKNLLKEAERLLSDRHSPQEIGALLDPVASRLNAESWRHQADGLAILRSPDVLEEFRLPLKVPELAVVAESFHVRPLIRCLNSSETYFLVALSQKSVRVFRGSLDVLTPTEIPGVPDSLSEYLGSHPRGGALRARASVHGGVGRPVHGSGDSPSSKEAGLRRYFRDVDRALQRALRRDSAPVMLSGVEYYLPIYRQISRLRTLVDVIVPGSPDATNPQELGSKAWAVAAAVLQRSEDVALEKYQRSAARGRASDLLEDIIRHARRGRVRRLLLASGVRVWGVVDPITGRVRRSSVQQGSLDDDVLDDVAEAVFQHRGEVITLPLDRMPGRQEVAAELR